MTRVLVTRPARQAEALAEELRARGLTPISVPTVAIAAEPDEAFAAALDRLADFDWVIFTSVNAVATLAPRLAGERRQDTHGRPRVAAVGPATAAALRADGIEPDHLPGRFLSVEIASGLGEVAGRRVLLAQADVATDELRDALVARGADVAAAVAYRTVEAPPASRAPLHAALREGIDLLTFASPSAVRGLVQLLSADADATTRAELAAARRIPAACIGPVTAQEVARLGFTAAVVARRHTAPDLAAAVADHLMERIR